MKKSKKVWTKIFSILGITLVIVFVFFLSILHIGFPSKHNSIILSASKKFDVDADLVRAVIWTESKYKKDAKSSRGAIGLMQLLPSTAKFIAEDAGIEDFTTQMLYDESVNINLGTYYLRYLLNKFDDETTALTAYNAGEGNVSEWKQKGLKTIPYKETRDYVKRVRFVKNVYDFKSK